MKIIKKVFVLFIILSFIFLLFACSKQNEKEPDEKGEEYTFVLDKVSLELTVGETFEITYKGNNLDGKEIEATIEDNSIASIDKLKITALRAGSTTITVRVKDTDLKGTISLVVKDKDIEKSLKISFKEEMNVGETGSLTIEKKGIEEITFTSSDPEVISVNNGELVALKAGTATITASSSGLESSVTITVIEEVIKTIELTSSNKVIVGETLTLTAKLDDNTNASWTLVETDLATLSGNVLTGVEVGSVIVKCKIGDIESEFTVEIMPEPSIKVIGPTSAYAGEEVQFEVEVVSLEGEVKWVCNNTKVATIDDNGLLTIISNGTVYITASIGDYKDRYKFECLKVPDEVVLDYDGGVSTELYKSLTPIQDYVLGSYAGSSVNYWTGYPEIIYVFSKGNDTAPTFSDRIYYGLNEHTGYYEIKGIITSGASAWPEGAEYVITYSSSYNNYRALHSKVSEMEIGDIVIVDGDVTTINKYRSITCAIYKEKVTTSKLTIKKEDFTTLPTPTKLGFEFTGWVDKDNNKVDKVTTIDGRLNLKATWNELNPVTELVVEDFIKEYKVGASVQINASVLPVDAYFQEVLYSSNNSDVASVDNTGLLKFNNAGTVKITVRDFLGKFTKEYNLVVTADNQLLVNYVEDFNGYMMVDDVVNIEARFVGSDLGKVTYSYESSNTQILSVDNGRVTALAKGTASIFVRCTCEKQPDKVYEVECVINVDSLELDLSKDVDKVLELLVQNNQSVVAIGNACLYNDGTNRYYKATYGAVNNFLFEDLWIRRDYEEIARNNDSGHRIRSTVGNGTIEFVTVHDTATLTSTAQSTASSMASGETSIHYTTGNGEVYSCVPEEFIAFHAGDGTGTTFAWYPTGVTCEYLDEFDYSSYPKITIDGSGSYYYFYINGKKTTVAAPIGNSSRTIENPSSSNLSYLGPVWKVENGEYYIGTTWVDFSQTAAGTIGSHGGNNNSIGIEMGVGTASNMYDTWMHTAKLVADILVRHDLDITRVKMHNTWTGKNCPQCLLAGGNWWEFMDMVSVEYIIRKYYPNIKITLSSDSDIIDSKGVVVKAPRTTQTVKYTITVSDGTYSKSVELSSVVPGSTSWERWNGLYSSSIIWNGGKFNL